MLDNLRIFISAAEKGSITEAALELGLTIPTASRRLGDLEKSLGVELFLRSNKGLTLTSAGKAYFNECAAYIKELELRLSNLDASINQLKGELKVAAPTNIGCGPLDTFWHQFATNYPEINLKIHLINPNEDITHKPVDIAICSGEQQDSTLIQKYLGFIRAILVSSPEFALGQPKTIKDLGNLPTISSTPFNEWTFTYQNEKYTLKEPHYTQCNDMALSLNFVKSGHGIGLLPKSLVQAQIEKGNLIQILPHWKGPIRKLYLVWPYQRAMSVRAQVFKSNLIAFLSKQSWFEY
ncbi:LysR family transcriptional regulator [Catenovulum sp. 2E275]|uniref:LysR family transcriptional regulator n=1 Tax=Catenovulum sp. 2E275 TaxID=2980497 RepID=UPI0021CE3A9F|nr:LysR family transcriptional regulator [Catenovulum sp. 2E275]MCU4674135.1 LysR family transcriptional regulator [Catenovulum sp. 2E275]